MPPRPSRDSRQPNYQAVDPGDQLIIIRGEGAMVPPLWGGELGLVPKLSPAAAANSFTPQATGVTADLDTFRWWVVDGGAVIEPTTAIVNAAGGIVLTFPPLTGPLVDLYYGGGDEALNVVANGVVAPLAIRDVTT